MKFYNASLSASEERELNYERLALTLRALGGGLWDYDIDADELYGNGRWYEILQCDPLAQPVRSIAQFRSHIHPDDVAVATTIDREGALALLDRGQCYRVAFRILLPDQSIRWVRSVASIVRGRRDGHLHAVGCVTEITAEEADALIPVSGARREGMRTVPQARHVPSVPTDGAPASVEAASESPLTEKEKTCLVWLSLGKTAWETATILGVSRRTVEFHLHNATRKLEAGNKVHAAFIAIRRGLLEIGEA